MSSISKVQTSGINLRAAGSKANGQTFGGIYYPAHYNQEGRLIDARWEANFFENKASYIDDNGNKKTPKANILRLVCWNSPNSKPGKGRADLLAKTISPGKELTVLNLELNTFMKKYYVNNIPQSDSNGNLIEFPATNFKITGEIFFGDDSEHQIMEEVRQYNGQANFLSRPQHWNVLGTQDNQAWINVILPSRMALVYQGEQTYGYARCVLPTGCSLVAPNQNQQTGNQNPQMNNQNPQMNNQNQQNPQMNNQNPQMGNVQTGNQSLTMPENGMNQGNQMQNQNGMNTELNPPQTPTGAANQMLGV